MKRNSPTPELAAARALEFVADGQVVGLGSGRAAAAFVHALAERVRAGMHIRGVPTSGRTAALAKELGIPLVDLGTIDTIDVAIDGADEVAEPTLDLVKGLGGALLRERVVAASARQWVILVGVDKVSPVLGTRGVLPVEVVPFAATFCHRKLAELGLQSELRRANGPVYVTDNGNNILDCQIGPLADPAELNRSIRAIPGVVEAGLFLGMKPIVLVQDGQMIRRLGYSDR
ncbi:MAG TPA: ribose-5-phosphate isomerase RpiA [Pirellulales bacterium]|nr:ribose-5-phosphate isomerase RpiA [Pirellulales bacterium]